MESKYYIIIDFEATCYKEGIPKPQEIIEFPIVVVDAETARIVDEIQYYVKPVYNTVLSAFCTELTGITQEQVDEANEFRKVLSDIGKWLYGKNYMHSSVITCGNWDFDIMFPNQCKTTGIKVPSMFRKWINIKTEFAKHYKQSAKSMTDMMVFLKIKQTGRLHSGIDDARNIAKIWCYMLQDGYSPDSERSYNYHT